MIAILDNIRSALNVGSIMRTCDAFGIKELYLCGLTPGKENPKVQKTALGAEKALTIEEFPNTKVAIDSVKRQGYTVVALEISSKSTNIHDYKTKGKIAVLIGNEVSGVSEEALNSADAIVSIPMKGIKESLNVAVAFGIAAYEFSRA